MIKYFLSFINFVYDFNNIIALYPVQKHSHAVELFTPPTLKKKLLIKKLLLYIMIKLTESLLLRIEYE